jgi:hypothetical protein
VLSSFTLAVAVAFMLAVAWRAGLQLIYACAGCVGVYEICKYQSVRTAAVGSAVPTTLHGCQLATRKFKSVVCILALGLDLGIWIASASHVRAPG